MNKKGFTLIELLAVILVLGIIVSLSVTGYLAVTKKIKENMVKDKAASAESSAISWGQDNSNLLENCPDSLAGFSGLKGYKPTFCLVKTIGFLVKEGYMETEEHNDTTGTLTVKNNVTNKSMLCDEVLIYRKNNRIYAVMYDLKSNNNYECDDWQFWKE